MGKSLFLFLCVVSTSLFAITKQLPLHTLRDQSQTEHCWAYASSHMLESRALIRDNLDFMIDIENKTKYWVDYGRMMTVYKNKSDEIYLGSNQGGWQIEFWETLIKYGKFVHHSKKTVPEIKYPVLQDFNLHLEFMPSEPYTPPADLIAIEDVGKLLKKGEGISTLEEAHKYIISYLDQLYGAPSTKTTWFNNEVSTKNTAKLFLGGDFNEYNTVSSLTLIKPIDSKEDQKWVKYLGERYWGYRLDKTKVLGLVKKSLDKNFPVTFDNVYHAMTIIGYTEDSRGDYFAVADSWHGNITWYDSKKMLDNLNLVTFFSGTIKSELPPKPEKWIRSQISYDREDGLLIPPM